MPLQKRVALSALAVLALAAPALAGPPLLCHPYEIGTARSLPWNTNGSWSNMAPGYDVTHLIADTDALLTPATPVIVRMETLRRASIYASTDAAAASQLLKHMLARVSAADATGKPDPVALLDAAYVAGAFRQIGQVWRDREFAQRGDNVRAALGGADGYALIARAVAARPDDAGLQFAAALIAADRDRTASNAYAQKARQGAAKDALLARNLDHVS